MSRRFVFLFFLGLLLAACGPSGQGEPSLHLSFATRALDGPCPEQPSSPAPPPALEKVEIELLDEQGQVRYSGRSGVGGDGTVHFGGVPEGEGFSLFVNGYQADGTGWFGSAGDVSIRSGRDTTVHVFMSAEEEVSCAVRPMNRPRAFGAAAALSNGFALAIGGAVPDEGTDCGPGCMAFRAVTSVDAFDSGTGVVFPRAPLNTPRALASATVLEDGRVLVAGGVSRFGLAGGDGMPFVVNTDDLVTTFELYYPTRNVWVEGPLPAGMVFHSATLLQDGRVLLAGGGTAFDEAHASNALYLYLPASGSAGSVVEAAETMQVARVGHSAVLTPAGKVLLIGGSILPTAPVVEEVTPGDQLSVAEKPSEGLTANLFFASASVIPERPDEVFLAGGRVFDGQRLGAPTTSASRVLRRISGQSIEWTNGPELATGRWLHAMHEARDQLVVIGGFTDAQLGPASEIEVFHPKGTLRTAATAGTPRAGAFSACLHSGRVIQAGGWDGSAPLASAELFAPGMDGE